MKTNTQLPKTLFQTLSACETPDQVERLEKFYALKAQMNPTAQNRAALEQVRTELRHKRTA